jgi:hypothetical protein
MSVTAEETRSAVTSPSRPPFATIETWCAISGLSRRVVYELLGTGELRAVKRGKSILVDVEAGLRYLHNLPAAVIRAPRNRGADQRAA